MGGIIPWEIFIADVLALPGQRACWKIPIFLDPCPTELVLRESVYKTFYPPQGGTPTRLPQRLIVGVESQNSLTKAQSREWLRHWKNGRTIELTFKMLPMDMMIHALKAEALDAIIAPSPWGIHAESTGLGKRDPRFSPGKFAQRLVMVCHREFLEQHPDLSQTLVQVIAGGENPTQGHRDVREIHRTHVTLRKTPGSKRFSGNSGEPAFVRLVEQRHGSGYPQTRGRAHGPQ